MHISDQEFRESADNREALYENELHRAPVDASNVAERTFMDRLGRGRWPVDYYSARLAGLDHQKAMQRERWEIRNAAGLPQPEPKPEYPPVQPPVTPLPARAVELGNGGRTQYLGSKLALPAYGEKVSKQVGAAAPELLKRSCQDKPGGTWEYLDLLVSVLRTYDTRWGYNGKRGNSNDPSKDVVDYHYGDGADEGSTDVYIIDVIGGHCGEGMPSAIWNDVTDVTINSGTIGRWTSRGRF